MLETISTMLPLPAWSVLLCAFLFGAIFGSFLDVIVSRFHTGVSINGYSRCMSCGTRLRWYELLPIVSYLMQGGRCRTCGARIPIRLFVMEVVTGLVVVLIVATASTLGELVALLPIMFVLLVITVYDYWHFVIPDEFTLTLTGLVITWLGYQWWVDEAAPATLLVTVGASLAGAAFFFVLWAVSRGRWLGFGDVKLAIPLGLWVGASQVFSFIVLSFWIGAVISVGLLLWQRHGRGKPRLHQATETLTMKSAVPFAPFMIGGAITVYFFHVNVLTLFSFAL